MMRTKEEAEEVGRGNGGGGEVMWGWKEKGRRDTVQRAQ